MATATELQQLYVAYFGRPADPSGLDYWVRSGISTKAFAAQMYAQPEFQSVNSGLSTESQVNQIYLNLFGRAADAAGLIYWTQEINAGRLQLASIANDLIFAVNNGGGLAADVTALANKTATANTFTTDVAADGNAILAYQPQSTNPWVSGANFATAVSFMNTATATNAPTSAQVAASVATVAANGAPGQTITLTTDRFSYIGGPGNDTFVAGTTTAGTQVLSALDSIDGAGGSNRLIATLTQTNSAVAQLANVQSLSITQTVNNGTFDLSNATGVTSYTNTGSTFNHTVTGLSKSVGYGYANTSSDFTINLSDVTGTSDVTTVSLTNVTNRGGVGAGTTLAVGGVETLNLVSSGSSANALGTLTAAAATTLNLSGSAALTIVNDIDAATTTINAGSATGATSLSSAGGNATVTGGTGNDQFTYAGVAGTASINAGAGDDTIIFAGQFTNADTVDGGTGSNALRLTAGDAIGYAAPATATLTNVQTLELSSDIGANALTLATLSSGISTLGLRAGINGNATVNGGAGSLVINIGANSDGGDILGGVLTVNDTGIATTDTLTLNNVNTSANSIFNNANLTIGGYESVTLNTGAASTAAQGAGAIQITPDLGAATTLTINGANGLTIDNGDAITAGTINASGLTGTAAFSMGNTNAIGATSIIGSANADTLLASSVAATIDGGAGNDTITSDANGDTVLGGAGNDTITSGAGNDSINAGEGDDVVNVANNLTAADTIDGGTGSNTLRVTAAVAAAPGARVSNFQTIQFDADNITQDMSAYSATTFTTAVQATGANPSRLTISNASASLNTLNLNDANQVTTGFARASDTAADALTVNAVQAVAANSALTASNEEIVTINASTFAVDLDLATMTDLTTLNITGSGAGSALVIDAQAATLLATVNASSVSGTNTLNVDATDSTVALTFTGGTNSGGTTVASGSGNDIISAGIASASVIDGGLGNDSITGGSANDSLSGAGGADTLVGGAGVDTLNGGSGADSLLGGDGNDVFQTSAGADTIDGGAGVNTVFVSAGSQDLSIYNISNATTLDMNNLASTLSIAQYNAFTAINNQNAATFSDAGTVGAKLGLTTYNLANGTNTFNAQADAAAATSVTGGTGVDTFNFTVANFEVAADSTVVGGGGNDTLNITDNTALTVANASTRVLGVETITLSNTTTDVSWTQTADIATGGVAQFIDAGSMTTGTLVFDGSAQTTAAQQTFIVTKGGTGTSALTGGAGTDSLTGGGGADTIVGAAGVDTLTGGAGADDFIMTAIVTGLAGAGVIAVDNITDFTVAQTDQIGNYSAANLQLTAILGVLNAADDQLAIAGGNLGASVTAINAAYDLGTGGTGSIISLSSATAFTNATVADALETGGALALTMNNQMDANDGIIVLWDNNVDSFVGLLTTAADIANNGQAAATNFTMTTLTTLTGVADASTIATANVLDFLA